MRYIVLFEFSTPATGHADFFCELERGTFEKLGLYAYMVETDETSETLKARLNAQLSCDDSLFISQLKPGVKLEDMLEKFKEWIEGYV